MPKGIMVVQSRPVSAEREGEYNDWYDNTHIIPSAASSW